MGGRGGGGWTPFFPLLSKRIQFTPDLIAADIFGTERWWERGSDHTGGTDFPPLFRGPIFANLVLADEINRTPAKTQAGARFWRPWRKRQVTAPAGQTLPLEPPFFVLATQNPIELEGNLSLPRGAVEDRFSPEHLTQWTTFPRPMRLPWSPPTTAPPGERPSKVFSQEEVLELQSWVRHGAGGGKSGVAMQGGLPAPRGPRNRKPRSLSRKTGESGGAGHHARPRLWFLAGKARARF